MTLSIKDVSLVMIILMYTLSFTLLGLQWEIADTHGHTLTNFDGVEIKSAIHSYVNQEQINQYTENITSADYTSTSGSFYDKIETSVVAGAFVIWELIGLLTGTHVFYLLILLGIPPMFVTIFVVIYILLLARAIIGYLNPGN